MKYQWKRYNDMGFSVDTSAVMEGFDKLNNNVKKVVKGRVEDYAVKLENYMKTNAPWEDRTGEARRGLTAEITFEGEGKFRITLGHTVSYGIYLEYREFSVKGRLSILEPTLNNFSNELVKILEGII